MSFIALPTAAVALAGRSAGRRLMVLELYQRADAARWGWLQWTERELVDAADGLVSRKSAAALVEALVEAGLAEVERSAPRAGVPSRIRLVCPTGQRANQDANQDANQRSEPRTAAMRRSEPEPEPELEPHARGSRPDQTTDQTTDQTRDQSARPAKGPPEGWSEAAALWRSRRPGVPMQPTRGDGQALARAISIYGAAPVHRMLSWVLDGPDPWAREHLALTSMLRPANVEGWLERSAGWQAPRAVVVVEVTEEERARQSAERLARQRAQRAQGMSA